MSDIQDHIKCIIKNHETLTTNPPINIYNSRTNNRVAFKIKYGCKLELQTLETMRLFGNTKKIIDKTKDGENVPCLELVEVALVQYNSTKV